jgi:peroxiredoxin
LLVLIGLIVASGSLQNLSASLSAEQADISLRIEECGLGYVQGNMNFNQARSCLNGDLHPVALGQSSGGTLNAEKLQMAYLIDLKEAHSVDIELSSIETVFKPQVTISDDAGNILATGSDFIPIEGNKYVVLAGVELSAGRYTVTIMQDGTEEVDFRLKMREAQTIETSTDSSTVAESSGIADVSSILDLAEASGAAVGVDVGNRAPDFTVTTIEGDEVALSDLRGQVVLLNFWGTWCGPCRREMPEFQQVYEDHKDEGFTILALAVRGDTPEKVVDFRDDFGLTFPLAVDEGDVINDMYGIISQPSTFILDEEGVIIYKNLGITLETQINEILTQHLKG